MTNSSIVACLNTKWKHFVFGTLLLLSTQTAFAQQRISGVVTNATNQPVANVSVQVKGTGRGVITNTQGAYTIEAASSETLVFSSVGMETREIPIGNQRVINVTLGGSSQQMEEVVITALGISRKQKPWDIL